MEGRVLYGESPVDLIQSYTSAVGRMRALPDWIISGALVGIQGGSEKVNDVWEKLKKHDVPLSGVWLQVRSSISFRKFRKIEIFVVRY